MMPQRLGSAMEVCVFYSLNLFVYLSAGAGCLCVCVSGVAGVRSLLICPKKGDRDLKLLWHALLKQSSQTTNKRSRAVRLPPDDFFLAFFCGAIS